MRLQLESQIKSEFNGFVVYDEDDNYLGSVHQREKNNEWRFHPEEDMPLCADELLQLSEALERLNGKTRRFLLNPSPKSASLQEPAIPNWSREMEMNWENKE